VTGEAGGGKREAKGLVREARSGTRDAALDSQRIRRLRPAKAWVDPYASHGSVMEQERRPSGSLEQTLTVFLAGAECPFTCSFCDLWRYTIDGATPAGALTSQLRRTLESGDFAAVDRIKLYNASNFFDARAVSPADFSGLATLVSGFRAVTVESHASLIGERALELARQISGRLEVAVGLETIHPFAASQLNKRLDLPRFDRAADFLAQNDVDLRVFVLLGVPHVAVGESVEWTARTVAYAAERGASVVSIIPVRGGNGELERLQALGHFTPPSIADVELALEECARYTNAVVTVDLWDIDRIESCEVCRERRISRLKRINISGALESRISCDNCEGAGRLT
jgi:archaeosine synthase beta-subunit